VDRDGWPVVPSASHGRNHLRLDLELNRFAPLLFGSLFLSGCVCFPFATPPMEISGGAAAATSNAKVHAAFPVEIAARPFGVTERLHQRKFDLGVGYRLVPTTIKDLHHGPTLSFSWLAPVSLSEPFDGEAKAGLRFAFTGQGHVIVGNEVDDPGLGGTFRFTTEWVGFSSGPFDTCDTDANAHSADFDGDGYPDDDDEGFSCSVGNSFGELGIGLFTEASYLDLGGRSVGWVGLGLSLRIPAAAGIGFASVLD
jgi:hypothetical protein